MKHLHTIFLVNPPRLADFRLWDGLNNIALLDAAMLWHGLDPTGGTPRDMVARVNTTFRRLKQEMEDGKLPLNPPDIEPKVWQVPRAALKKVALAWDQKPAFLFPDQRPPTRKPPSEVANKCNAWLRGQVKSWEQSGGGQKPKTKTEYWNDARELFGKDALSHKAFDREWVYAVPPEWRAAGRRRKKACD